MLIDTVFGFNQRYKTTGNKIILIKFDDLIAGQQKREKMHISLDGSTPTQREETTFIH